MTKGSISQRLGKSSKECERQDSTDLQQGLHLRSLYVETIVISAMAVTAITVTLGQPAYAACIQDEDWPDKPCLDTPPYSKEYLLQVWQQYYEYKGKEWMEAKKAEMDMAIQNGSLREWVETQSSPNNFANYNVWYYYNLNGEAPDAYGRPISPAQIEECKKLGIELSNCNDATILTKERVNTNPLLSDEEKRIMEDQQNTINNSVYKIGIGAAIAGVVAFITLRKIK